MITTADTIVKTVETSFMELPDTTNTQTRIEGLTFRELKGLDKALLHTRDKLANNSANLTDIDKDKINEKKRQLGEAEDEISKKDIRARLNNFEDQKVA